MKLSSTRQAIHDALAWGWQQGESSMVQYLTYLTRIEKSIVKGEPCGDFLEAAYICAAINTLGTAGGWLKFCYGPEDSVTLQAVLAGQLRNAYGTVSVRKHQRLMALCITAVEDYRLGCWRERTLPIHLYAERMGTDPNHFERDWGDKKRLAIAKIRLWDSGGVGQVGRMIRALKGPTEPEDRPSQVLQDLA